MSYSIYVNTNHRLLACTVALSCCSAFALPERVPRHSAPPALVARSERAFTVGPLSLGMSPDSIRAILGAPKSQTGAVLEPASGSYVKTWRYPDKGVELGLASDQPGKRYALRTIILTKPCTWTAPGGVKVGMSYEAARAGMKGLVGPGVSVFDGEDKTGSSVLFEESYNVLSVTSLDGKVTQVSLGPGPE